VSLNGIFVRRIQGQVGTGEHPRHYFAIVELGLVQGEEDTLRCIMSGRVWPPPGLEPGDLIEVSGKWSFDRMLAGGFAPGGGPLHIAECKVARPTKR
jgi:hypothetical protein